MLANKVRCCGLFFMASMDHVIALIVQQSSVWLSVAEKIKDQYALAAYSIAAILAVLGVVGRQKLRGKPILIVVIIIAVLFSASLPAIANYSLKRLEMASAYRISVSVINSDGSVVEDPSVSTDVPSHVYKIGSSIQVEVPDGIHIPADRKITLNASNASGTVRGQKEIHLGNDRNPRETVTLEEKPSEIHGNVFDRSGSGIKGVRVSVIGYDESTTTGDGGLFIIKTHTSKGEAITLLAEKPGYTSVRQQHIAGPDSATITLEPTKRMRTTH